MANYFCHARYCSPEGFPMEWSITVAAADIAAARVEGRKWLDKERPGATKVDMTVSLDRDQPDHVRDAAPDLLEAAKLSIMALSDYRAGAAKGYPQAALKALNAAIARAEGRA